MPNPIRHAQHRQTITVAPEGDKLGGGVTAVAGATRTIQGRHGSTATLLTTGETKFFTKVGAATLTDIIVGSKVMAFGAKQSDGKRVKEACSTLLSEHDKCSGKGRRHAPSASVQPK